MLLPGFLEILCLIEEFSFHIIFCFEAYFDINITILPFLN